MAANSIYISDNKHLLTCYLNSTLTLWQGSGYRQYGQLLEAGLCKPPQFKCPSSISSGALEDTYPIENVGVPGQTAVTLYAQRGSFDQTPKNPAEMAKMKALLFDMQSDVNLIDSATGKNFTCRFLTHPNGVNVAYTDGHVGFVIGDFNIPGLPTSVWNRLDAAASQ